MVTKQAVWKNKRLLYKQQDEVQADSSCLFHQTLLFTPAHFSVYFCPCAATPALHHGDESACLHAGKMILGRILFCLPMQQHSFFSFFFNRIQEHGPHFFTSSGVFLRLLPWRRRRLRASAE